MSWVEGVGYLASILVFSTFYMKTMIPLRFLAIASNVAFITYGFSLGLYPVLILHILLLPVNVFRLLQMRKLIAEVKEAYTADLSLDWMMPFVTKETFEGGEVLFRKGDEANKLYLLAKGSVRLPEIEVTVTEGAIVGEMGIFSPYHERTSTAICETDSEVLTLTEEKVLQLYYQNPKFGFYLVRLIIRRLLNNLAMTPQPQPRVPSAQALSLDRTAPRAEEAEPDRDDDSD